MLCYSTDAGIVQLHAGDWLVQSTWDNVLPSLGFAPGLQNTGTPNPSSSSFHSSMGQNCGLGELSLGVSGAPCRAVALEQLLIPVPACAAGLAYCVSRNYLQGRKWLVWSLV